MGRTTSSSREGSRQRKVMVQEYISSLIKFLKHVIISFDLPFAFLSECQAAG